MLNSLTDLPAPQMAFPPFKKVKNSSRMKFIYIIILSSALHSPAPSYNNINPSPDRVDCVDEDLTTSNRTMPKTTNLYL